MRSSIDRIPPPVISAPGYARDWNSIVPAPQPAAAPDTVLGETLDKVSRLPAPISDGIWGAVKLVNRVLFPSTPANPPMPAEAGSWKFTAIGDYGSGRPPLEDVAKNIARGKPDLIVTLGDNVYYNGTEEDFQKRWDPPEMFGNLRRDFPVMPSLGNHDLRKESQGAPYFKRFPELNKARYYSFENKGVHFVSINSNESLEPGSPQYRWLEQDLAQSKQDWNVLYFHHPMFSGFPMDNGPNKSYLAPLLAKYGVDLVLTGHEHSYQRSAPLNPGGTIEVIAGGGGQSLHPFPSKQLPRTAYRDVDFGHVEVEVRKNSLVGRYVVRNGTVRDTFEIKNNTPYRPDQVGTLQATAGNQELQLSR